MSFDVALAGVDKHVFSSGVLTDTNGISSAEISVSRSGNACKDCPHNREYYIVVNERGCYKAHHAKAKQRIEELEKENKELKAKLRMREQQLFGKQTEKSTKNDNTGGGDKEEKPKRNRGQQPGQAGHGRGNHSELEVIEQIIEIPEEERHCMICRLPFEEFPGTEDSDEIVVDVKAHKRRIKRKRYKKTCECPQTPGIIMAEKPAKLIPKGILDTSVWVKIILDKYYLYRPTARLLRELQLYGATISQGTVTGGLKRIAVLFDPVLNEIEKKNKSASHWHGDETRWQVFELIEGKETYRWYLWVFATAETVLYILDPSRSARVPRTHFAKVKKGILSVDRYVAYKVLLEGGRILLAFCWAHQRRDFLNLARSYPELEGWAIEWVDLIGELYRLNDIRVSKLGNAKAFKKSDEILRKAVDEMEQRFERELAEKKKNGECRAILKSMKNHWAGLTVFVDYPEIPLDNNEAERRMRGPAVGRKNFYGSGAVWSGHFGAAMFSVFQTLELWGLNQYTWLTGYLEACAGNGGRPPADLSEFLPWQMPEQRLRALSKKTEIRAGP